MAARQQGAKTVQIRGERYSVYERPTATHWRIRIKKGTNQKAYVPAYRTGWEDGGEVEIFTLLPVNSDTILLQVRIYTKANYNEKIPSVARPDISVQCSVPAFVFIEQERQHVLIELMCVLTPLPEHHRMRVMVDPMTDFSFATGEV